MDINIKKLKENKLFIICEIAIFLILVSINIFLEKTDVDDIVSLEDNKTSINKLVINEILTDNQGVNIDEYGNLYDWIELYNGTNNDINLKNYGLSDKDNGAIKWAFPDVVIKSKSYLIVYLTGEKNNGLYANFSLKKDGDEIITLKSPMGKVVDAVKTLEIPENNSMSRNSNGIWNITNEITPGYENNVDGRKQFLYANTKTQVNTLKLSEVLPKNEGNVIFNNKLYDYVEVINNTDKPLELSDYYLSNDKNTLYKWKFPNIKLESNDVYLVYMNGLNIDNNSSFDLKNKTGKIFLSNKDGIVDSLEYENLTNGISYLKVNNSWIQSGNISPGYRNDSDGKIEFQKKYDNMKSSLVINEVMTSNSKYLSQNGNQYYDFIELYNNGNSDILLSNYTLTTNMDDMSMYKLPEVTLKPNEYYILMASGDDNLSNSKYNHTNFKLSSGEGLFLYNNQKLIDSVFIYNIPKNYSYGRGNNFGHYYFSNPSPNLPNHENGIREISYTPVFNIEGGIYNNVSSVEVKLTGNGNIYYTLDGSTPNEYSNKYIKPIILTDTTVVKAITIGEAKKSSEVITNSYIINENHTLPVMSISLNNSDFNNLNYNLYGDLIVNSYAELFDANSSFSSMCGLKLFGGSSRKLDKKSFVLEFNNKYSLSNLNYKVFDDKEIVEFSDLVLRSGSQDQNFSMIRDEFVSKMIVNYGTIVAQDVKPIILYINGKYWGIYYIREKINEKYIQNNYNVSTKTNIVDYLFKTEDGENTPFIDLKNYLKNNDITNENNYKYVTEKLDIDYFIDYYVIQFITNNTDLHNIRLFNNENIDNGKIKVILYDSDYAFFGDTGSGYINFLINQNGLTNPPDNTYIRELMKNKTFKKRFVKRISYYMNNVWTEEHILETYNYLYNSIKPEMKRNAKRWNQSYDRWLNECEILKNRALSRTKNIPNYTKNYFNLSKEEYNEYFKS